MELAGIDHVVLRVRDLERAVIFYRNVLGCTLERRQDVIGMVQMRAGRSLIDLIATDGILGLKGGSPPAIESHNMDHLCLAVVDFEIGTILTHLQSHGVAVGETGARYGAGGEGLSLYLADPEGNRLELRAA
ncbi:MAG: VOC family protein [Allorhizobium sp.]